MSSDSATPTSEAKKWRRKNPYPSQVLVKRLLSGEGSAKEIYHYEFDLGESGITYNPGDGLGVIPLNDADLVSRMLDRLEFTGEESVPGRDMPLRAFLTSEVEICRASSGFLKLVAERGNDSELQHVLDTGDREAVDAYLWSKDCLDILNINSEVSFVLEELPKVFRPLMHRTYSISSSPAVMPRAIHATVATVRFHSHGREHGGVASTFLSDRVVPGDTIGIFMVPNRNFQLPQDTDTPIIMIGPGTGVAPFLSFLLERQKKGDAGKNWLFFGDQHRATDYIYQTEIEHLQMEGVLHELDLAFSRDSESKYYVQHRMKERGAEVYRWIQQGAYIYVCGDATRMAPDVDEALRDIIAEFGGISEDQAIDFLEKMQLEKRYLRDVY